MYVVTPDDFSVLFFNVCGDVVVAISYAEPDGKSLGIIRLGLLEVYLNIGQISSLLVNVAKLSLVTMVCSGLSIKSSSDGRTNVQSW